MPPPPGRGGRGGRWRPREPRDAGSYGGQSSYADLGRDSTSVAPGRNFRGRGGRGGRTRGPGRFTEGRGRGDRSGRENSRRPDEMRGGGGGTWGRAGRSDFVRRNSPERQYSSSNHDEPMRMEQRMVDSPREPKRQRAPSGGSEEGEVVSESNGTPPPPDLYGNSRPSSPVMHRDYHRDSPIQRNDFVRGPTEKSFSYREIPSQRERRFSPEPFDRPRNDWRPPEKMVPPQHISQPTDHRPSSRNSVMSEVRRPVSTNRSGRGFIPPSPSQQRQWQPERGQSLPREPPFFMAKPPSERNISFQPRSSSPPLSPGPHAWKERRPLRHSPQERSPQWNEAKRPRVLHERSGPWDFPSNPPLSNDPGPPRHEMPGSPRGRSGPWNERPARPASPVDQRMAGTRHRPPANIQPSRPMEVERGLSGRFLDNRPFGRGAGRGRATSDGRRGRGPNFRAPPSPRIDLRRNSSEHSDFVERSNIARAPNASFRPIGHPRSSPSGNESSPLRSSSHTYHHHQGGPQRPMHPAPQKVELKLETPSQGSPSINSVVVPSLDSQQTPSTTSQPNKDNRKPPPPAKVEPEQPPPKPTTPPPSPRPPNPTPSAPSGYVLALTRLADLEAQMEFQFAKLTRMTMESERMRVGREHVAKLPVGRAAFRAEYEAYVASKTAVDSKEAEETQ